MHMHTKARRPCYRGRRQDHSRPASQPARLPPSTHFASPDVSRFPQAQPLAGLISTANFVVPPGFCVTAPHVRPPLPRSPHRLFNCDTLNFPRVPARVSKALVLRTYPFKEADLVVSFLTRDQGKLRGVARRARRPKGGFGAGLGGVSYGRVKYYQRETRELVNLDSCELIQSQFGLVSDYQTSIALDYFAEVAEQMLPSAEPSERFFRLLLATLESLRGDGEGSALRAVNYFSLWAVRLSGWLPELHACLACGGALDEPGERAFFSRGHPGLTCGGCRRVLGSGNSWELRAESRGLAAVMLRRPVGEVPKAAAADLRRFLVQQIEAHVERRLVTAPMLEG